MRMNYATGRFQHWFVSVRSTSAHMKRPSGRPHSGSPRVLRVEPLEQRQLLSVTVGPQTWKDFDFTSTGIVSGKMVTPQQYNGRTYNVPVTLYHNPTLSGAEFNGKLVYTSANQGTIGLDGGSMHGEDAWKILIPGFYNESGTWTLNGSSVELITDAGGNLSGSVSLDDFTTSVGLDLSGVYPVNGSFNTSTLSLSASFSIKRPDVWGTLTYNGKMTPTDQTPFDINFLQQSLAWGAGNSVSFDVKIDGPVHTAKSETMPFTDVQVFWATGSNLANKLPKSSPLTLDSTKGGAYNDGIPLYWNQASGRYTISNFLPAAIPANATNLLFVANFNGHEKLLGTLALPTVSISDATVSEPAQGAIANAQFTVTLTTPSGFTQGNVTVAWKTSAGAATPGLDFTTSTGTVTFNAPGPQTITVPVKGDNVYDPSETFKVTLSKPTGAGLSDSVGVGTIADDFLPKVSINNLQTLEPAANKKATVNFAVSLLHPVTLLPYTSTLPVSVNYAAQDGTAIAGEDYQLVPGVLRIAANKSYANLGVIVFGNGGAESALENFFVDLSNAVTSTGTPLAFSKQQGVGEIRDRTTARTASRDAGLSQVAGSADWATYFDQLDRKKNNKADRAVDLVLTAMLPS